MPPEEIKAGDQTTGPDPLAGIRTILTGAGRNATNVEETIRQLIAESDELATLREQNKDIADERKLADDGRKYRSDLIDEADEAIAEGVRAHGADFAQETSAASCVCLPLFSLLSASQVAGYCEFAGGNAASLTVGQKFVGALGAAAAEGFIRVAD